MSFFISRRRATAYTLQSIVFVTPEAKAIRSLLYVQRQKTDISQNIKTTFLGTTGPLEPLTGYWIYDKAYIRNKL